ncbi:ABC transporter substrate-binding protein [Paenibacillus sp. GCM10023248]|uniref:ABC transporter substrate-binding protein n=1 Tax=unclassified Paenibacillus TaxID=185978 RepID=UPI0023788C8B|nr:extracellular solute-binding protein [Paenibacillus sp. MAHUQ-63]MDD9266144.1 extracellular solute-binding protein [Paenibacillus sp. MAHUQ-63]
MMKWKRSLGVVLATALAGSLVACANGGNTNSNAAPNNSTAPATAAASNEPVKLRIMWWGATVRHEATLAALKLYTEKHPNVTFEPEYSGIDGYLDKLSTQAAANNAPDIMQLDPGWISDWAGRNQLAPLTGVNVEKIDAKVLSGGQAGGKQYAMPLGSVAYGMIYDKAAMDKLGLKAPQNGWTWDDFFALAKEAKTKLPEGQYFTKDYAGDYFAYSAYQYAKGKGMVVSADGKFNVDQASFLEWTRNFEELRKAGIVPPADVNSSDKEFDPKMDLMVNGKILFRMGFSSNYGSWDSLKKGAYALVTMPRSVEAGGWLKPSLYLGVSATSKKAEEAKKFVDWFVNDPEAAKLLTTVRGLPVNKEIAASLESSMSDVDKIGSALLHATEKDGQTWNPGVKGWTNYIDKDWPLIRDQLSFGKTTPEKAFEQLKVAAQAYEK